VTAQTNPPPSAELGEAEALTGQVFQLYKQGNYKEAIPLAERAIAPARTQSFAIYEQVLGKSHLAVATALSNLAVLSQVKGDTIALSTSTIWNVQTRKCDYSTI